MFPSQGFGVSLLDENAHVVKNCDTSLISPNTTHSQVAGAGYARSRIQYIWMIPHLPNDKWLPTTRYYREQHTWMLDKNVKIWPERKYETKVPKIPQGHRMPHGRSGESYVDQSANIPIISSVVKILQTPVKLGKKFEAHRPEILLNDEDVLRYVPPKVRGIIER